MYNSFNEDIEINIKACLVCNRLYPDEAKFCDRCAIKLSQKKESLMKIKEELVRYNREWKENIDKEISKFRRIEKKKSSKLTMDDILVLYNKAYSLSEEGNYNEAIKYYDKILRSYPDNAKMLIYKGCALHSLSKYDRAIECYDKALKVEPENSEAWENKGAALNKQGKYDEATKCFNRAGRG